MRIRILKPAISNNMSRHIAHQSITKRCGLKYVHQMNHTIVDQKVDFEFRTWFLHRMSRGLQIVNESQVQWCYREPGVSSASSNGGTHVTCNT